MKEDDYYLSVTPFDPHLHSPSPPQDNLHTSQLSRTYRLLQSFSADHVRRGHSASPSDRSPMHADAPPSATSFDVDFERVKSEFATLSANYIYKCFEVTQLLKQVNELQKSDNGALKAPSYKRLQPKDLEFLCSECVACLDSLTEIGRCRRCAKGLLIKSTQPFGAAGAGGDDAAAAGAPAAGGASHVLLSDLSPVGSPGAAPAGALALPLNDPFDAFVQQRAPGADAPLSPAPLSAHLSAFAPYDAKPPAAQLPAKHYGAVEHDPWSSPMHLASASAAHILSADPFDAAQRPPRSQGASFSTKQPSLHFGPLSPPPSAASANERAQPSSQASFQSHTFNVAPFLSLHRMVRQKHAHLRVDELVDL